MFDDIEKVEPQQKPNRNSWKYMNRIQKTGVIGSFVLYAIALPLSSSNARPATIIGICGWSCLLFGYVAGSLWKVRHALHFWYSMAFACIIHACLLPLYSRLAKGTFQKASEGKLYIYLSALLVCAETIFLVFLLRWVAMRLHERHAKSDRGLLGKYDYGK